eukprot:TRINITY_DN4469_c0_g1_i4.p2 TRINITY_DN4469_c0_g1~~TRINITY_DN4469_c0_g1_i4.p2  ORF type:complete len:341 (-),score=95.37 TRINITY_DN4469_c0_g1_i4:1919-2941(-)
MEKELLRIEELERENIELRLEVAQRELDGGVEAGSNGESPARSAATAILNQINNFYHQNEAALKENEALYTNFTDFVIAVNDESFLTTILKSPSPSKRNQSVSRSTLIDDPQEKSGRLTSLLSEIQSATAKLEVTLDEFRRVKDENAANIISYGAFSKDLAVALKDRKAAQDVEAARAREAAQTLRETVARAEFAESAKARLAVQHEELSARFQEFARDTIASHEKQIAGLRETYDHSLAEMNNLNRTLQETVNTTRQERDELERKALDLGRTVAALTTSLDELYTRQSALQEERNQLETRVSTLLEHNKGLLERLSNLNQENLSLHNTIVTLNALRSNA